MDPLPRSNAPAEIKHWPQAGQRESALAPHEDTLFDHHIEELLNVFDDLADLPYRPGAD